MKKIGLKALYFTLICSMIFVGSAFALNDTDHVSVAPNGKGDVLIFPAYFTTSGWTSKIIVTNSSLTRSVVAKVIIRSKELSQELRDFMIYLSPADVWTGTLMTGTDGRPHIVSTDDSCLSSTTTFASEENPFDTDLVNACEGDQNEFGYVTIIEGASFAIAPGQPGVDKEDIRDAADTWFGRALTPQNVLVGQMEINNNIANVSYGLNATTLKNYDWDIANKLDTQNETKLGANCNNSMGEIEAALAKNNVVVPYYSQDRGTVFAISTFPTKLSSFGNCTVRTNWTEQFAGFPTPSFSMTAYNLQEDSIDEFLSPRATAYTFPSEVNFLSVADLPGEFDEGWMHIVGTNYRTFSVNLLRDPLNYTGFPMISSSMRFNNDGHAAWLYNAYTPGDVDLDNSNPFTTEQEYNYHYWGQADN